jgi:hypothetical protein
MMSNTTVVAIVEGDGEVAALPVLLRRIGQWQTPETFVQISPPIRVHRDRFLNKPEEFNRHLQLASKKCGAGGWILILLDADDDCPKALGQRILAQAQGCIPHRDISVVLANREFEAWFIAAAQSLHGKRGFSFDPAEAVDAEQPRDAKGWIKKRMTGGAYGASTDQPAFAASMDLQQAHARSRSFRKLCSEWRKQVK